MRSHFLRAAAGSVAPAETLFTYTDTDSSTNSLTAYTFSAMAIGDASADRYVVVCLGYTDNSSSSVLSSVTIGGVSAEIIIQKANGSSTQRGCAIARANVPSGTTADVVATFDTAFSSCCCHVGVYYGACFTASIYSDSVSTPGAIESWTTGTTVNPFLPTGFYIVNYLVGTNFGTAGDWTGVTSLAESAYASSLLHAIASKDPSNLTSIIWERSITPYHYGGASTAVLFEPESYFASALPVSISNFTNGSPSNNVSAINETTVNTSTWIADTNNNTATIGFGSLTIASSGPCRLVFYMTVYNQQTGIQSNNGVTTTSMNNGAIGGYTIFASLSQPTTWTKYTYDFDASNISSGTINFTWTNVRAGSAGNRTGAAIAWAKFFYTAP